LDVAEAHRSTFYTEFSKRLSTTTGSLLISNGNFRVSDTASFPNVPRIYVGENATFTNLSTRTGNFAGCTDMIVNGKMYVASTAGVEPFGYRNMNLELGENAELTLPADYTLTVLSLKVNGDEMPDGTYETGGEIGQIKGGTIVVQGIHETVEATWTGEGADTSVGTADNWSGSVTPDFAAGNLVATFASGGTTATADRAMALLGLKLAGSQSFTIAGSSPISLDSEGLTVIPAASPATERYFRIEPTVTQLSSINQVVDVPESNTVDFVNGYVQNFAGDNVKKGAGTLRLGGESIAPGSWEVAEGTFALSGTNRIDKQVTITNGVFSVSGRLYQVGGNPSEYVSGYNYTQGVLDGLVNCSLLDGIPRSRVEFNNVEFAKRFSFRGPGEDAGRNWFTIAAGSTNLFTGEIMVLGDCGYMTFGGGSDTTFRGPLVTVAKTIFCRSGSGPATVTVTNAYFITAGGGLNLYDGIVLKIAESLKTQPTHLLMHSTSRMEFIVNDCYKAIDDTSTVCDLRIKGASSVVDLGATRQTIPRLNCSAFNASTSEGSSSALITGLPGAELRVQTGYLLQNVTGGVSVTSYGISSSHWLTTTARAYSSTGDIKAERGIFRFVAGSSWPNGTNVTICAGATLEVNRSRTFGDHAVLHAEGEGWTLSAAAGVRQKFAQFYIDGVRQPDGVYGAAGNGAVMYRMDNITGEGVIVVGTPGSILILR